MRHWPFLVGLAAISFASHGAALNDEDDQASALWNLAHGSLRPVEHPAHLYFNEENELREWPRYDHVPFPIGSTLLNILALPVAGVLVTLDRAIPLWLLLPTVALALLWQSAGLAWPWRRQGLDRLICTAALVVSLAAATMGFRAASPDQALYFPVTALQVTNLGLWALCGWLLWDLLRPRLPESGRAVAVTAFLLGPMLFWAQGLKYHMLTATLALAMLWLRSRPRTARIDMLLGAAAALLVWANLGPGVAAVAAIAAVEAPRLALHWRDRRLVLRQWGAILLGFAIGIAPFMAENAYLTGNPFLPPRLGGGGVADGAAGEEGGEPTVLQVLLASVKAVPGLVAALIQWPGIGEFARDLASLLTFGHRVEGGPLGVLFISPWLVAAAWSAWNVLRGRLRMPEARLAVAYLAAFAVVMTEPAVRQGAGVDVRMWLAAQPAFALLAAIALAPLLRRVADADLRPILAGTMGTVGGAYLALALLVGAGWRLGPTRYEHVHAFLLVVAALAVAAAMFVLGARLVWPRLARLAPRYVAYAMLVPALTWSIMFLWVAHTQVVAPEGHDGGGMFIPAMDPVAEALRDAVLWKTLAPIVYDGEGNLFFHPDYGRCHEDPNPCPEHLWRAPWVGNMTHET